MSSPGSLDKKKIAKSFSRYAETYDRFANLQKSLARELVDTVKSLGISPANILDIGTGTGEVAFLLHQAYPKAKITGCDIAPGMIEKADEKNRFDNLSFDICDAEFLPYKNKTFDLAASSTAFQWMESLVRAFAEAYRVLKDSSHFVFITFGPDSLSELKKAYRLKVDENAQYLHEYKTVSEVGFLLEQCDFKVVSLSSRSVKSVYPNFREMQKTIKSIGALNASVALPKGLRSKSKIKEMVKFYESNYRLEDQIYATYEIIEAVCVKT
jgi:malonyl-CoA O-methyltransferase